MKKRLTCIAMLMICLMLINTLAPVSTANATNIPRRIVVSADSLSEETLQELTSKGITITENTAFEFELCELNNENLTSDLLVLKVYNDNGRTVTADIIVPISEESYTNNAATFKQMQEALRSTNPISWTPFSGYTIYGSAIYSKAGVNPYNMIVYRPTASSFYVSTSGGTFNYVYCSFDMGGVVYTLPAGTTNGTEDSHSIAVSKSYPVSGVTYSNTSNPYYSGKYFDISSGMSGGASFYIYLSDVYNENFNLTTTLNWY